MGCWAAARRRRDPVRLELLLLLLLLLAGAPVFTIPLWSFLPSRWYNFQLQTFIS